MIDIEEVRASRAACADIPWSCPCVSGEQLDALLDELELLRDMHEYMQSLADDETQAEREAVVALLRAGVAAGRANCAVCMDEAVVRLAREIERGEHRREEER